MLRTHGGKSIQFDWCFEKDLLIIKNEKGRIHKYKLEDIFQILTWLEKEFGSNWFPLANNVEKLGNGTEKKGFGVAIIEYTPGDINHAQGASYLGVVLEHIGILEWNGKKWGIQWRLSLSSISKENIRSSISTYSW